MNTRLLVIVSVVLAITVSVLYLMFWGNMNSEETLNPAPTTTTTTENESSTTQATTPYQTITNDNKTVAHTETPRRGYVILGTPTIHYNQVNHIVTIIFSIRNDSNKSITVMEVYFIDASLKRYILYPSGYSMGSEDWVESDSVVIVPPGETYTVRFTGNCDPRLGSMSLVPGAVVINETTMNVMFARQ